MQSREEASLLHGTSPHGIHQSKDAHKGVGPECSTDPAAAQVVVDAVDPGCLVSDCNSKLFDFGSASSADLEDITIPLRLQAGALRA